jgi:hypothetical protein
VANDGQAEVNCAGALVEFVKECVQQHNATALTPVFVRDGSEGPMKQIVAVKMGIDSRGHYIVLETSAVLIN